MLYILIRFIIIFVKIKKIILSIIFNNADYTDSVLLYLIIFYLHVKVISAI